MIDAAKDKLIQSLASPPAWLQRAWTGARRRGVDALTFEEVDTEIVAYRNERRPGATTGTAPKEAG